jgi:hypothetical protein
LFCWMHEYSQIDAGRGCKRDVMLPGDQAFGLRFPPTDAVPRRQRQAQTGYQQTGDHDGPNEGQGTIATLKATPNNVTDSDFPR